MASVNNTSGTGCGSARCLIYDGLGRIVEIDGSSTPVEIWYTQLGKTAYMNVTTELRVRTQVQSNDFFSHYALAEAYWLKGMWPDFAQQIEKEIALTESPEKAAKIQEAASQQSSTIPRPPRGQNPARLNPRATVSRCELAECSSRLHSNASLDSIRGRSGRRIVNRAKYH